MKTSTIKNYCGTCEKSFKERYNNHKSSFRNKSCQKSTELSNYIWKLKENGKNYTINWLIAMKPQPYIYGMRKCDLCLCKKLLIAKANSASLLNKHSKFVSKCHHMNKLILKCFKNTQGSKYPSNIEHCLIKNVICAALMYQSRTFCPALYHGVSYVENPLS